MNTLTQEMIDAGATALCGLTREQAKDALVAKRFQDAADKARWLWTLMTAAAPKANSEAQALRDQFAMQAITGKLPTGEVRDFTITMWAQSAYRMADAMMVERAS